VAFYEASGLTIAPAATIDLSYINLWNSGTADRLRVREIGMTNTAATAAKVGLKRTTARGTNTTTVLGTAIDNSDAAAAGTLDLTWSVESTKAGNYLRRAQIASVIGAGLLWTWWNGPGLVVPTSAGITLVVPTAVAGSACECWMVWEE